MPHSSQFEGAIPPEYGTTPVPEGAVRFNHYTHPDAVAGIREHGILRKKSEERFAVMGTESPQIFANAGRADKDLLYGRPVVEGWAHPDEHLDIGRGRTAESLEARHSTITFHRDVPREQILHIHEPWHMHARTIMSDERYMRDARSGALDSHLDDPEWGPAITYAKEHGPK